MAHRKAVGRGSGLEAAWGGPARQIVDGGQLAATGSRRRRSRRATGGVRGVGCPRSRSTRGRVGRRGGSREEWGLRATWVRVWRGYGGAGWAGLASLVASWAEAQRGGFSFLSFCSVFFSSFYFYFSVLFYFSYIIVYSFTKSETHS